MYEESDVKKNNIFVFIWMVMFINFGKLNWCNFFFNYEEINGLREFCLLNL